MQHLFLSDVHLGAFSNDENHRLEQELISLIRYCTEHNIRIHVLGDLFDYWMEFPDYTPPLGRELLEQFQQYNKTCGNSTFITGNHDCWTFGHLEKLGFSVEQEYLEMNIGGHSLFLFHGDGLADKRFNFPRPLLNHILRNKTLIIVYQTIFSGETGNHLMKSFSELTRNEDKQRPHRISEWAKDMLKKQSYDYIISGHDHVPRVETFSNGSYINTGAYFAYKTMALYNNNRFELVVWNSTDNAFQPFDENSKNIALQ